MRPTLVRLVFRKSFSLIKANFESKLRTAWSFYLRGVEKLSTSPYHPQTDGETERMNRSILEMLRHYTLAMENGSSILI